MNMAKYVNANKTSADLVAVCTEAIRQRAAGQVPPRVNGVTFEHYAALGWCQQHVREAVEATAFGREGDWEGAKCCATRTAQFLRTLGYAPQTWATAKLGDLIYWSPCGSRCGTCKQDAGHTGILHHLDGATWYVWQNTSSGGKGMCIIPLQSWQRNPVGIFRAFPLAAAGEQEAPTDGERRINWHGQYLDPADVVLVDGAHFLKLRAVADAQGDVVKIDAATGKVFVGPASWWPKDVTP